MSSCSAAASGCCADSRSGSRSCSSSPWCGCFSTANSSVALPQLGGFGTDSYLQFLAPGIAILSAFSHGAWEGGGVVQDIERGAIDRFLATPLPPGALLASRAVQAAITGTVQALLIVAVAIPFGAHLDGGLLGLLAILAAAGLVCVAFASFTHALALLFRRQETMIAVGQFAVLPLMFTSVMLTSAAQMPPLDAAGRERKSRQLGGRSRQIRDARDGLDLGVVHLGALAALAVATADLRAGGARQVPTQPLVNDSHRRRTS